MSTAEAGGITGDAQVQTSPEAPDEQVQRQREQYADGAEAAVAAIEAKLAGMKESLATAKAEAKRLRAEADKGGAA